MRTIKSNGWLEKGIIYMNATQELNNVGGPTEAEQLAARKSPPAIPPQPVNGVPQTDLPEPPPNYVWH